MSIVTPSLGFLLFDIARLMRKRFDRLSSETGLTRAQFQMLARVSKAEGVNQAALADLLDMEPISVCRTIDRMEASGLLVRKPDPKDRRAHLIFMTQAARPALEKMQLIAAEVYAEVLEGFSATERQTILSLLTRLHANAAQISGQQPAQSRQSREAG